MIIKNKGYEKKFILGGSVFTPLWNMAKSFFSFLYPKALEFGKKQALNLASKGAETLGKKASEKAKDQFLKLLASKNKNKNGINNLSSTDPSIIRHEAPTLETGLNEGINRGLGIKII